MATPEAPIVCAAVAMTRAEAVEASPEGDRRLRPRRDEVRLVVERRHEYFVAALEQAGHEAIHRPARLDDRLPAHAVAGIEQHAEADRHALIRELGNRLRDVVLEDLEVVPGEAGHQPALGVHHRDGDLDGVDARPERLRGE